MFQDNVENEWPLPICELMLWLVFQGTPEYEEIGNRMGKGPHDDVHREGFWLAFQSVTEHRFTLDERQLYEKTIVAERSVPLELLKSLRARPDYKEIHREYANRLRELFSERS